MRTASLLPIAILAFSSLLPTFGDTPLAVAILVKKLTAACQAHDLKAIKACYDTDGASEEEIDLALSPWQDYFGEGADAPWIFDKISYRSLEDLKSDPSFNPLFLNGMTGIRRMGEHDYQPNLPVIGAISSNFTRPGGSTGNTEGVGLTSDGTAQIVLLRVVK